MLTTAATAASPPPRRRRCITVLTTAAMVHHLLIRPQLVGDPIGLGPLRSGYCGPTPYPTTGTWQSGGVSRADSLRDTSRVTARLSPHCRESHAAGSAARRVSTDSARAPAARNRHARATATATHTHTSHTTASLRRPDHRRTRSAVHDGASERNLSGGSATLRHLRRRGRRTLVGPAFTSTSTTARARSAPPRCSQRPLGRHLRLELGARGDPARRSRRWHRPRRHLLGRQRLRRLPARRIIRPCRQLLARLRRAPRTRRDAARTRARRCIRTHASLL